MDSKNKELGLILKPNSASDSTNFKRKSRKN